MTQFNKPALDVQQQLALLKARGMAIADDGRAKHYLATIGYYRLSGYAYPFRQPQPVGAPHTYIPGTDFDQVLDRYVCDRQVRVLVMDAIERVEVGIRTAISNHMSCAHGPHWFMDPNRFLQQPVANFSHKDFLRIIQGECHKSSEAFIVHYRKTYTQPVLPPSWMIMETASHGAVSKLFANLPRRDRVAIADAMRIDGTTPLGERVVGSWLNTLTELRNACAHHSRLLLRTFMITAIEPKAFMGSFANQQSFYPRALILHLLLRAIAPGSHWKDHLTATLQQYMGVTPALYGFPQGWDQTTEWGKGQFHWPV
jgi:abortive infection bacteriophage resistance protein